MIAKNIDNILKSISPKVQVEAAVKQQSIGDVQKAILAGIKIIGDNYVKEAKEKFTIIGKKVQHHFIGYLQKNKVKTAVEIFDMIETIDSLGLAEILDKQCKSSSKIMPILIEVNSGREAQKHGLLPENVEEFLEKIIEFTNLRVMGLMTMGPWLDDPECLRPHFKKTKELFDSIRKKYCDILDWRYLSMGMSNSYKVAIEEGANIVRIGEGIFGKRQK